MSSSGNPTPATAATPATPATDGDRTVAWFHCFAGIAGDMALASLLDAGADLHEVVALVRRVPMTGWDLHTEPVLRGGIAATRAVVTVDEAQASAVSRPYRQIVELVSAARLPRRVAERSLAVFAALAAAEGTVHRRPMGDVHFHEVGGHDAVVDVVGTAAALEVLGVDEVAASAVATGTGTVSGAHGLLPNPAPAVVRLLAGAPVYGRPVATELTTPTGAALLVGLGASFGPLPPLQLTGTGFGAGSRELAELPNCVQVIVGTSLGAGQAGSGQPVVELATNLDDVTGEQLAHAVAALLDAGAHDAWISPAVMKKGRPGHVLHALADPALAGVLRQVMRHETGTFGVRATSGERWPVARSSIEVVVAGLPVRMKVGIDRAKPEFDDVAAVAEHTGRPVGEIAAAAVTAWEERVSDPGGDDDARRAGPPPEGDQPS